MTDDGNTSTTIISSRLYGILQQKCNHGGTRQTINTSSVTLSLGKAAFLHDIKSSCSVTAITAKSMPDNRDVCLYYLYWRSILQVFSELPADGKGISVYTYAMQNYVHLNDLMTQIVKLIGRSNIRLMTNNFSSRENLDSTISSMTESFNSTDDHVIVLIGRRILRDELEIGWHGDLIGRIDDAYSNRCHFLFPISSMELACHDDLMRMLPRSRFLLGIFTSEPRCSGASCLLPMLMTSLIVWT